MMSLVIAGREFRSLFLSPLAWAILAVIQIILAWMFLAQLDVYLMLQPRIAGMPEAPGTTDLVVVPLFGNAGIILLLVTPLLTMRLISEERRNKTLSLLFSAPISMAEIVIGKYLGILGFLLVTLAGFAALGLYMSSLAAQPTVAAVTTFGALLLLWILDWSTNSGDKAGGGVLEYLSILKHYEGLLKGLVSTTDILYFVLFISTFLILTIHRLDSDRLQS